MTIRMVLLSRLASLLLFSAAQSRLGVMQAQSTRTVECAWPASLDAVAAAPRTIKLVGRTSTSGCLM